MASSTEQNTITIDQALDWGKRWKEGSSKDVINNSLKAFLIPGIDLKEVLAEINVQDVRTYFGIDKYNVPHLMIVGVDANGNDMIDIDPAVNEKNGWNIYDFSLPCPKTCDPKSPLFIAN